MGVPQVGQNCRVTPGEEVKVAGVMPVQAHAPSATPKKEAKAAPVARRQLSQWQCICQSGGASQR